MGINFKSYGDGRRMAAEPPIKGRYVIDVSRYGQDGWNALSPMFDHGAGPEKRPMIPVPGMEGRCSRSVEGIWQGLKVFPGEGVEDDYLNGTELQQLDSGKPRKRKGKPLGHLFAGELLVGVAKARRQIYLPAYEWMVMNCPLARAKFEELVELSRTFIVYVFDRDKNGDIDAPAPLAHASILATLVKRELQKEGAGVSPR